MSRIAVQVARPLVSGAQWPIWEPLPRAPEFRFGLVQPSQSRTSTGLVAATTSATFFFLNKFAKSAIMTWGPRNESSQNRAL